MAGTSRDQDDIEPPTLSPEARRQEATRDMAAILLRVQYEKGLLDLEDTVRGAMAGIGDVLGQVEGGHAYFVELCSYFGGLARTLRDRPPTSGVLQ